MCSVSTHIITSSAKDVDINLLANINDKCVNLRQQTNSENDRKKQNEY